MSRDIHFLRFKRLCPFAGGVLSKIKVMKKSSNGEGFRGTFLTPEKS